MRYPNLSLRLLIPDADRLRSWRRGDPFSHPSGSSAGSGKLFVFSLALSFPVFVVVFLASNRSAHPASAGPENVQCRSVFIHILKNSGSPRFVAKPRVQPVFDSRHGRIACKTFSPQLPLCRCTGGTRPPPITSAGLDANPNPWLRAALPNSSLHLALAGCPNIRMES